MTTEAGAVQAAERLAEVAVSAVDAAVDAAERAVAEVDAAWQRAIAEFAAADEAERLTLLRAAYDAGVADERARWVEAGKLRQLTTKVLERDAEGRIAAIHEFELVESGSESVP